MSTASTPLDEYVWTPDSAYNYVDLGPDYIISGKFNGRTWTGYTLNMTSQRWLSDSDFSEGSQAGSLWWHYLVVIVPDEVKWTTNGTLYITGGSNNVADRPTSDSEDILVAAALALANNIVTGALFQIPNEHMTFAADPIQKSRTEDAIIAFTWDHFLKDPTQPNWLVRFPMIKATLRAMDTISSFMATKFPDAGYSIDYYSVSGASKRGWTTWLVGAVDPKRVVLIVPIVLDALNFAQFMHPQYRSYGNFSFALGDYSDMQIMSRIDDPNMFLLQQMEDPYCYRNRLTMPKLIVNAVLDEFQQPDDTNYWWNEMPEPKHFIMTPNAEHSEATGIFEIVPAISAFIKYNLEKSTVPKFTWDISTSTGAITTTLDEKGLVHEANVWWAYSCGTNPSDGVMRRDFRCASLDNPCKCGIYAQGTCANLKSLWSKQQLNSTMVKGHRTFSSQLSAPGDGRWIAYMVEVTYRKNLLDKDFELSRFTDIGGRILDRIPPLPHDLIGRLVFTSQMSIWPNTFPYPDCQGVSSGASPAIPACGNGLC
jgi:PhoPQ-activated pathogenicity-related protein